MIGPSRRLLRCLALAAFAAVACKAEVVQPLETAGDLPLGARYHDVVVVPDASSSSLALVQSLSQELAGLEAAPDWDARNGPAVALRLEARMGRYGATPAGRAGAWDHRGSVRSTVTTQGSLATATGETVAFTPESAEALRLRRRKAEVYDAELAAVEVGHGVTLAAAGHDDYDGVEVRGAIVVVKAGVPDALKDRPEAEMLADVDEKFARALRAGAAGCLVVAEDDETWERLSERMGAAWVEPGRPGEPRPPRLEFEGVIRKAAWKALSEGDTIPRVRATALVAEEYVEVVDVLARIPGSTHPDENILVVLEWDDPSPPADGRAASAVALAVASELQRWNREGRRLSRSVTFALLGGAELDHAGVATLLDDGPIPAANMTAVIVLSHLALETRPPELHVAGVGASTLTTWVHDAATALAWPVRNAELPGLEAAFLEKGVPAISVGHPGWTDPPDAPATLAGLEADARLLLRIVSRLGLDRTMPTLIEEEPEAAPAEPPEEGEPSEETSTG